MQKIGVFVCWCGSNIAGTVDVAQVVEAVRRIPDVAYAIDYKYMCSEQGQELIPCEVSRVIGEMGKEDMRFTGGKEASAPDKASSSARLEAMKAMLAGKKG